MTFSHPITVLFAKICGICVICVLCVLLIPPAISQPPQPNLFPELRLYIHEAVSKVFLERNCMNSDRMT